MADRAMFPINIIDKSQGGLGFFAGSFAPAGTGAPTTPLGKGFTAARTSQGLYTVTMANAFSRVNCFIPFLSLATPAARFVQTGLIVTASKTIQIRNLDNSGNVQDIAANANNRIGFIASLASPDNCQLSKVYHLGHNRLMVLGSFAPNGSGQPAAAGVYGDGFSVVRNTTGKHTLTFLSSFNTLECFIPVLQMANAGDQYAIGSTRSASAGTAIVYTYDISGGAPVDITANADNRVHFLAIGRLSATEA